MVQNTILEFLYTSPLYKSFYEQVFQNKVPQESTRTSLKRWKCYSPTSRKAGVFKAPSRRSYKICRRRFFSYESFNARKKKIQYQRATYKKSIRFAIEFFVLRVAQFKKAKDFYTTSYLQGQRSVCPKPRIPFFWFTNIWVQKRPVSVSVSAPT